MAFKKIENLKVHIFTETETICPRCGSNKFDEIECGEDSYENDIAYTSEICKKCGLWWDGWQDKWLIDCDSWVSSENCDEYEGVE